MKKVLSMLAAGVLCMAALPAVSQDVHTDYDHNANFERYRTFCVTRVHASNQIVENRMRDAITSDLTRRGLQQGSERQCDLTIAAIGQVSQRQEYTTFYDGLGPGWGWGRWRYGWGWGGGPAWTTVDQIPVGTLIVDVYDSQSKNLIFRGVSRQDLSSNPDKNANKLFKAVDKIFDKYPGTKH